MVSKKAPFVDAFTFGAIMLCFGQIWSVEEIMMKWRKIRWKLLFCAGLVYRLSVIVLNTVFLWAWSCDAIQSSMGSLGISGKLGTAMGTSLPWAVINLTWYYIFHGFLLKTHKFGGDVE
ncbi:MAG: hypothetical protein NTY66_01280 [Candidatus Vogelbacteria bacterium]|nr:hypothetical protein [Candidatus Vogelbacteria bacterium]